MKRLVKRSRHDPARQAEIGALHMAALTLASAFSVHARWSDVPDRPDSVACLPALQVSLRKTCDTLKHWFQQPVLLVFAAITLGALPAHSQQTRAVIEDYATQMAGSDQVTSLGPGSFGDSTDLYTGATRFLVTDVSLPGNSDLPVALQRSLEASDSGLGDNPYGLPDSFMTWTRFEVPYLSGVYPDGWVSSVGYNASQQRCSLVSGPPEIFDGKGHGSWDAYEYWHGNHLYLPGSGEQLMLIAESANVPTDGQTYYWATKDHWYFSCLSSTANGAPGEGFLARSPDGKKYYFDYLVWSRDVATLWKLDPFDDVINLPRDEYRMLLTRVEDRFGNWVRYTYSGKDLAAITASDGRQLTLTYAAPGGVLTSVSDGTRTWTYDYSSGVRVTFPDSTIWRSTVSGPGIRRNNLGHPDGSVSCDGMAYTGESTLTIQHRSGATGTFVFRPMRRGLSHIFYNPAVDYDCPQHPKNYDNIAAYSKSISGPGLSGMTWSYVYGPPNGCHDGAGAFDNPCTSASPTTRYVEVHGPGTFTRYTFGNKWRDTDGTLFRTETGSSSTNIVRDGALTWQTFPAHGHRPGMAGESFLDGIVRVVNTRTITQDGATYTTTHSSWDAYFNPQTVAENGPNGGSRTTQYTYYNNRSKWVIGQMASSSSPGKSMSRSFDTSANVSSITKDGVSTGYTYHADGTVSTITYPRSLTHSFSSYKRGIPQSESQPEGINLTRTVSDAGFVISVMNGEGRTSSYARDALGRITSIDYPRGNDATIAHTGPTKSVSTSTRGALVETVIYDALWRPVSITRGGIPTTYEYDAYGRRTFASNPSSTIGRRYEYDVLGRIIKITHPDSTFRSFSYGPGNVTARDERSNYTTRTYRAYGDPGEMLFINVTTPDPTANMTIGRAANGLVDSITQAGRTRTFDYDTRNYLISETHPETGATTYERDAAGNMTARLIGGARADFLYDGQNRPIGVTYSDSTPAITQTWSRTNRLRTVSSSTAARLLEYDQNDNVTSESLSVGSTVLTAQYGYDGNDQLSTITYPISNSVISYSPNALGRPTQVSGYASSVTYWPLGLVRQIDYANGVVTNYDQNARSWPSAFHTWRGSVYSISSTYGYDNAGNLTSVVDAVDGSMNRSLGYDAIDRLTSASGPWGVGSIVYDGAGNITSQNLGSFNLSYAYDSQNRLGSVSGSRSASYAYDAYGNVSNAGGISYVYDSVPNLLCANCVSGNRTDYSYDGLRNRATVVKSGRTTYEFYAFNGDLLAEYTPSQANRLVEHIYLNGSRIAQHISDQNPPTPVTPTRASVVATRTGGVTLTVDVGGASPSGTVTFREGETILGTAYVIDGRVSIDILGLALGSHTITATYSGDVINWGNTVTFQMKIINLDWLPAILDLLLN